jgi:hypothetical protein
MSFWIATLSKAGRSLFYLIANQFKNTPELPQKASFNTGLTSSTPHSTPTTSFIRFLGFSDINDLALSIPHLVNAGSAWTPFIKPPVMGYFPVVSVCCFASTQGSGGRRA